MAPVKQTVRGKGGSQEPIRKLCGALRERRWWPGPGRRWWGPLRETWGSGVSEGDRCRAQLRPRAGGVSGAPRDLLCPKWCHNLRGSKQSSLPPFLRVGSWGPACRVLASRGSGRGFGRAGSDGRLGWGGSPQAPVWLKGSPSVGGWPEAALSSSPRGAPQHGAHSVGASKGVSERDRRHDLRHLSRKRRPITRAAFCC